MGQSYRDLIAWKAMALVTAFISLRRLFRGKNRID